MLHYCHTVGGCRIIVILGGYAICHPWHGPGICPPCSRGGGAEVETVLGILAISVAVAVLAVCLRYLESPPVETPAASTAVRAPTPVRPLRRAASIRVTSYTDRPVVSPSDTRLSSLRPDWQRVGRVVVTPTPCVRALLPSDSSCFPWWDSRTCWGCEKGCKFRKFNPYGHTNIGAEIRGASAARARADRESPGLYHAGFAPETPRGTGKGIDKAGLWDRLCEDCGTWIRAGSPAFPSGPSVVDGLDAAVDGCPF